MRFPPKRGCIVLIFLFWSLSNALRRNSQCTSAISPKKTRLSREAVSKWIEHKHTEGPSVKIIHVNHILIFVAKKKRKMAIICISTRTRSECWKHEKPDIHLERKANNIKCSIINYHQCRVLDACECSSAICNSRTISVNTGPVFHRVGWLLWLHQACVRWLIFLWLIYTVRLYFRPHSVFGLWLFRVKDDASASCCSGMGQTTAQQHNLWHYSRDRWGWWWFFNWIGVCCLALLPRLGTLSRVRGHAHGRHSMNVSLSIFYFPFIWLINMCDLQCAIANTANC